MPLLPRMRLNPLARNVLIQALILGELCRLPIDEALHFIKSIKMNAQDNKLLDEVRKHY